MAVVIRSGDRVFAGINSGSWDAESPLIQVFKAMPHSMRSYDPVSTVWSFVLGAATLDAFDNFKSLLVYKAKEMGARAPMTFVDHDGSSYCIGEDGSYNDYRRSPRELIALVEYFLGNLSAQKLWRSFYFQARTMKCYGDVFGGLVGPAKVAADHSVQTPSKSSGKDGYGNDLAEFGDIIERRQIDLRDITPAVGPYRCARTDGYRVSMSANALLNCVKVLEAEQVLEAGGPLERSDPFATLGLILSSGATYTDDDVRSAWRSTLKRYVPVLSGRIACPNAHELREAIELAYSQIKTKPQRDGYVRLRAFMVNTGGASASAKPIVPAIAIPQTRINYRARIMATCDIRVNDKESALWVERVHDFVEL